MSQFQSAISGNSRNPGVSAFSLSPTQRQVLAIKGLAGASSITDLAKEAGTSRKFMYAQKEKAQLALNDAFLTKNDDDHKVLFYLPVTKEWLRQFIIVLTLVCRSSYQGVMAAFEDLLDTTVSKGHIHNVMHGILEKSASINQQQDLSKVRVAAHDEIFQAGKPVLVGCDADSTYCYLLAQEEHRDGNTWGVHLLNLQEQQKLNPEYSVADGGTGLRKGQKDAWPDTPCHGDVFHALKPCLELLNYLDNRAYAAISECEKIEKKLIRQSEDSETYRALDDKLTAAQAKANEVIALADDVRVIYNWLKNDILSLIGPDFSTRQMLLDFVVAELKIREPRFQKRIGKIRSFLENQGDNLLQFANKITQGIEKIAKEFEVDPYYVRGIYCLQGIAQGRIRHAKEKMLHEVVGTKFYAVESEINHLLTTVVRASSVVENLNSRLRNYFTLRRYLGQNYLTVLQFFLNHRRFMRSQRDERVGRSPRELMTKESHPHWLEMLGFKMFQQTA